MSRSSMNGFYALRWKILERDNFTCRYCGQHAPDAHLEVDHIIPISEGGTDDPDNLATSCFACNRGKSALSIISKRKGKSTLGYKPRSDYYKERSSQSRVLDLLKLNQTGLRNRDIAKKIDIHGQARGTLQFKLRLP